MGASFRPWVSNLCTSSSIQGLVDNLEIWAASLLKFWKSCSRIFIGMVHRRGVFKINVYSWIWHAPLFRCIRMSVSQWDLDLLNSPLFNLKTICFRQEPSGNWLAWIVVKMKINEFHVRTSIIFLDLALTDYFLYVNLK